MFHAVRHRIQDRDIDDMLSGVGWSGFEWDPNINMVVSKMSVWDGYVQVSHPPTSLTLSVPHTIFSHTNHTHAQVTHAHRHNDL